MIRIFLIKLIERLIFQYLKQLINANFTMHLFNNMNNTRSLIIKPRNL